MKIIDERIQKQEVLDLSAEMIDMLVEALGEDYEVYLADAQQQLLRTEISKVLARFFSVKV